MNQARAVRELQAALHLRLDAIYAPTVARIRAVILRLAEDGILTAVAARLALAEIGRILAAADERAVHVVARGIAAARTLAESAVATIEAAWRAAASGVALYLLSTRRAVADRRARAMTQVRAVLDGAAKTGRAAEDVAVHLGLYANPRYATRRTPRGALVRETLPRTSGPALPGRAGVPARQLMVSETVVVHGEAAIGRAVRTPGGLVQWIVAPWHVEHDECDFFAEQDTGWGPGLYDPRAVPGRPHAGCMPAGVLVSGPLPRAGFDRWYDGQLIEITTVGGKFLPVTPNHPILTPHGWVAADLLMEGDNVVCGSFGEREAATINPDDHHVPALIEDVAESLRAAGSVSAVRVPTTTEAFHGDGADGEVRIVRANRLLEGTGDASLVEPVLHHAFIGRDVDLLAFAGLRGAAECVEGIGPSAFGGMSSLDQLHPIFGGRLCIPESLSGTVTATLNAGAFEARGDDIARDREGERDGLLGLSVAVATDDLVDWQRQIVVAGATAGIDRIAGIGRRLFAGHVYNLETSDGWFIANGIVTHNCQCVLVYVPGAET